MVAVRFRLREWDVVWRWGRDGRDWVCCGRMGFGREATGIEGVLWTWKGDVEREESREVSDDVDTVGGGVAMAGGGGGGGVRGGGGVSVVAKRREGSGDKGVGEGVDEGDGKEEGRSGGE